MSTPGPSSDREAYLESVLIGGRERAVIRIVEYDDTWPERFRQLRQRIRVALGPIATGIEHIGSTSVPGLAAKPIIDILVTVPDIDAEDSYRDRMEAAGFPLRVRESDHRMFRTPQRDVHVHFYVTGHPAVAAYLDFRDWLRANEEDRLLYEATKRALAERQWKGMNDYADAKSDVVAAILSRARS